MNIQEVKSEAEMFEKNIIGWVAVKDKLPQVELDVLVYDGFSIYITNRLDTDDTQWCDSGQIFDEITHWMELPKPPN